MSELSVEIRRLRLAGGMNQTQLGAALRVSKSLIAGFETGRHIPQADTATNLDQLFGTDDKFAKLSLEAREDRYPWMRPWVEHERRALLLRTYEPLLIPGLLQTEGYMRAVLATSTMNDGRIDDLVRTRLERQAATLGRDNPVVISAIIGEFALSRSPREVMKDQLGHLVDLGHRPSVKVRVLPDEAGLHLGLGGAFVIASLPDGRRCGYLDNQLKGTVVSSHGEVTELELAWESVDGLALPVVQSRDLMLRMIDERK
ncbi:helix-turn-helix transcriptional regulator [Solwaraspora sp. WMMD406]|uniref:helix-turn-helix domain-containing protein n=1 Tax=Solwaraspora sp. WMMD406 TaxID=3016095 RepID=UPI0024175FC8|nr:helix-turn-helix transcriptional regulator [Solwaraspora sp. WMMD406]MDG4764696.1 helix-turn-helix transcriptional regulator [Solwaraspora sp. WMMD406]